MSKQQPPEFKHGDILTTSTGTMVAILDTRAYFLDGNTSWSDIDHLRSDYEIIKIQRNTQRDIQSIMCHVLRFVKSGKLSVSYKTFWEPEDPRTSQIRLIRERMESDAKLLKELENA